MRQQQSYLTPAKRRALRLLWAVVIAYGLGLLAVLISLRLLSDRWWVGTLILFAPRWVWSLPVYLLLPLSAFVDRKMLGVVLIEALIAISGIMDFQTAFRNPFRDDSTHSDIRVMTYNAHKLDVVALERRLETLAPDIVAIEECTGITKPEVLKARGWYVDTSAYELCLLSRFPIDKVDVRDPQDIWKMNGAGAIVRYELRAPKGTINFQMVHLETVRDGLEEVMYHRLKGVPTLKANIAQRDLESRIARAWLDRGSGPSLVAGDFNMPVESAIYQRNWSSLDNAFSVAGWGLGPTKESSWHGLRIDHILFNSGLRCDRAWVGPDFGSDHLPMLADFTMK